MSSALQRLRLAVTALILVGSALVSPAVPHLGSALESHGHDGALVFHDATHAETAAHVEASGPGHRHDCPACVLRAGVRQGLVPPVAIAGPPPVATALPCSALAPPLAAVAFPRSPRGPPLA